MQRSNQWIAYSCSIVNSNRFKHTLHQGTGQLKCDGTRAETRFRLSAKWTSPFKLAETSVQSTTGSRGVRISGNNAGCTMFLGSVKGTGYPLHLPVSPSLPLPCVTMCHHISTGVYWLCITGMFRVYNTASKLNTGVRSVENNQWWPRL